MPLMLHGGEGGGFGISPSESANHSFEGGKASKRSRAAGKWRGLVVLFRRAEENFYKEKEGMCKQP